MTTEQGSDMEHEIKDLQEENELLLLQLHQVQEELESYYLRNLELENRGDYRPAFSEANSRRLQHRYKLMRESTSWRITAPMRVIVRKLLRKSPAPPPPSDHAPLSERIRFYERRIQLLENSTSWKLTSPYRLVGDVLRHGPGVLFGRRAKEELQVTQQELAAARQTINELENRLWDEQQARWRSEQLARQNQQALDQARTESGELRAQTESKASENAELHKQTERLTEDLRAAQSQIEAKDSENAELQRRQALMNEELAKAEAQVDLIKELLVKQFEEKE